MMRHLGFFGAWLRSFIVGPWVFLTVGVLVLFMLRFFMRKRERAWSLAAWYTLCIILAMMVICSFSVVPYVLERPLVWQARQLARDQGVDSHESGLTQLAAEGRLAILVLGGGAGEEMLTLNSLQRLERGRRLMSELPGSLLLFSEGMGNMKTVREWSLNYLRGMGVDVERVVFESESQNTRENIANSLPILERLGVTDVILVTGTRHMPRAYGVALDLGLSPYIVLAEEKESLQFYPEWNAYLWLSGVLNEYAGIVGYKLVGWM